MKTDNPLPPESEKPSRGRRAWSAIKGLAKIALSLYIAKETGRLPVRKESK